MFHVIQIRSNSLPKTMNSVSHSFKSIASRTMSKVTKSTKIINLDLFVNHIDPHHEAQINQILQDLNITKTYQNQVNGSKHSCIQSTQGFVQTSLRFTNDHPDTQQVIRSRLSSIGIESVVRQPIPVPWFPKELKDLNKIGKHLYESSQQQPNQDHPYFTDLIYRKRKDSITNLAANYRIEEEIPVINYTNQQNALWKHIISKLQPLHKSHFCSQFNQKFSQLNKLFKISQKIPQLRDLSHYLQQTTGFRIKPVHGIISQRQFLNSLAFRTFLSTQYLRHPYTPEYTPEPDIVHQIIGHVPMFADRKIAEISEMIGLLSLGATDEEIRKLGTVYWFTIEFGVCKENGAKKAYGAGIASCVKEILNFAQGKAKLKPFQPQIDCHKTFPSQTVQPLYCYTQSFEQALRKMQQYSKLVQKPFTAQIDPQTHKICWNRDIESI